MTKRLALIASLTVAIVAALAPATTATAADQAPIYPVHPGTAAWAALPNHEAMVRVTQLPPGVAKSMSTDKLAATVLAYPLLRDALAYNSVQEGIEAVAGQFNGLAELLRRPNAGTALLARYRAIDVDVPASATPLAAGDHSYAVWAIESLLAQPPVVARMSDQQLDASLKVASAKYAEKQADTAVYGPAGLEPTAVLLGRTLATREGWNWRESALLRDAIAPSGKDVSAVLPAVTKHFAEPDQAHPIGGGISTQDHASTVYTPNGTAVPVTTVTTELSSAQITSNNNWVAQNYPSASRETNSSRKYNCHSYAWYSTSTANDRWMNTPGDDKYWTDGSYTRWHPPYIYFSNMRWSWANGDHSGIEVGTSGNIRSKWGQLPRMYHRWDYSPYNRSVLNQYFR